MNLRNRLPRPEDHAFGRPAFASSRLLALRLDWVYPVQQELRGLPGPFRASASDTV